MDYVKYLLGSIVCMTLAVRNLISRDGSLRGVHIGDWCEHMLINHMLPYALKSEGGYAREL
jgi:hypothetical protein